MNSNLTSVQNNWLKNFFEINSFGEIIGSDQLRIESSQRKFFRIKSSKNSLILMIVPPGIEESVSETVTPAKETTEAVIQPSLSLEDEDTLTPEVEPVVEQPVVEVNKSINTDDDILDAEVLDAEFKKFSDNYEGKEIPRPDHWGGVIIQPEKVEVWKSRDDYKTRLHDRIVFTLSNDQWIKSRLYP